MTLGFSARLNTTTENDAIQSEGHYTEEGLIRRDLVAMLPYLNRKEFDCKGNWPQASQQGKSGEKKGA